MSSEWDIWAEHHAAIFALTTEADGRMLAEWCGLFAAAGWTPAELREATDWIALHDPPRFRSDQLAALQDRIRRRRQQRGPPPDEAPDEWGMCVLCRGAGLVPVPNPRSLAEQKWTTMAVACRCALGRWFGEHGEHGGHLTLEAYEASHPDWRRLLEEHDRLLKQGVRARESSRAVDRVLGEVQCPAARRQRRKTEVQKAVFDPEEA